MADRWLTSLGTLHRSGHLSVVAANSALTTPDFTDRHQAVANIVPRELVDGKC
jgi:hypothetical protein